MRVAVCISGQLRNWQLAYQNHMWFWTSINRPNIEVDYFVHTWDYSLDRTASSKPYEERKVTSEEFEQFLGIYQPKKYIIDSKRQEDFYGNDHWSGLFYSFVKSINLKREYELENNFNYDIVIKSRPDVVFHPRQHCHIPKLENGAVHTTHGGLMPMECNMYNFDDCVFVSNSYTMDLLVNLYLYRQYKLRQTQAGVGNIHLFGPGTLMMEYFRDYGITPLFGLLEWFEILIKAGCPENLDLLNHDDFNQMQQYWKEWYER